MIIWKFIGMVVERFLNEQRLIPLQIEHIYAFIVELTGNPCPIVELLRFCG